MKLGIIVRKDKTGLGYQTHDYVKHLNPSKIIVIDLSPLNGNEQQNDWYESFAGDKLEIAGIPNDLDLVNMLVDIDVLLTAETPYNMRLYEIARKMGVKTVCVENAEFYDHIVYPDFQMPDLIIMPSVWKLDEIKRHAESRGTKVVQIHHPVDRDDYPFRLRTSNQVMHIAGKPAAHDRNGTEDFLKAYPTGLITTQSKDLVHHLGMMYRHCTIHTNIPNNQFLYQLGDILVLPRRYGGNCLVLNEALSSGMPVIMTDISPNNYLLPSEWLVPAHYMSSFSPRTEVPIYAADIQALTDKIEWMRGQNIQELSQQANEIADTISWTTLLPKYREALESLL